MEHIFRVFKIKYNRLSTLVLSEDVDDALELSAVLRHLLLDGSNLAADGGKAVGLQVSIPVPDEYKQVEHLVFDISFKPTNNAITYHNVADFLKLKVCCLGSESLTVYEVIDAVANAGGGVHHSGNNQDQIRRGHTLVVKDGEAGLIALQAIGRFVIDGLKVLRTAVDGKSPSLEQRKRTRQPQMWMKRGAEPIIHFDGRAYLEGYQEVLASEGFTAVISFTIPKQAENPREVLFEIGNRSDGTSISLARTDAGQLTLTYQYRKTILKAINIRISASLSDSIVIRLKKSDAIEVSVNTLSGFSCREPISSWPEKVVGKMSVGADLGGRDGAVLQNPELIVFNSYLSDKDVRLIFKELGKVDRTWCLSSDIPPSFVTCLNNQS